MHVKSDRLLGTPTLVIVLATAGLTTAEASLGAPALVKTLARPRTLASSAASPSRRG